MTSLLIAFLLHASPQPAVTRDFTVGAPSEVIATISAGCARCDWGEQNREALLLELRVDGRYSQHVALVRGAGPADYPVMLGRLAAGTHTLALAVDRARSGR